MKKILLIGIMLISSLSAYSQFSNDEEVNKAIFNSKNSLKNDMNLFYGFRFGMNIDEYTSNLDSLVKAGKAEKKEDIYLIYRDDTKYGAHFQVLIPTFKLNRLTEIVSYFFYESGTMDELISILDFESKDFKKYTIKKNGEFFYFLFKNNIMISASRIDDKYQIQYTNMKEEK